MPASILRRCHLGIFTGWDVLANIADNGVYICSGDAHDLGMLTFNSLPHLLIAKLGQHKDIILDIIDSSS